MSTDNERRQDLGLPVIPDPPEHRCVKGWLGETADGLPVPCLTCRPWLQKKLGHSKRLGKNGTGNRRDRNN